MMATCLVAQAAVLAAIVSRLSAATTAAQQVVPGIAQPRRRRAHPNARRRRQSPAVASGPSAEGDRGSKQKGPGRRNTYKNRHTITENSQASPEAN